MLNLRDLLENVEGAMDGSIEDVHEVLEDVKEYLQPVEPIAKDDVWWCGVCRYPIAITKREIAKTLCSTHYCPRCGKAVKWDD